MSVPDDTPFYERADEAVRTRAAGDLFRGLTNPIVRSLGVLAETHSRGRAYVYSVRASIDSNPVGHIGLRRAATLPVVPAPQGDSAGYMFFDVWSLPPEVPRGGFPHEFLDARPAAGVIRVLAPVPGGPPVTWWWAPIGQCFPAAPDSPTTVASSEGERSLSHGCGDAAAGQARASWTPNPEPARGWVRGGRYTNRREDSMAALIASLGVPRELYDPPAFALEVPMTTRPPAGPAFRWPEPGIPLALPASLIAAESMDRAINGPEIETGMAGRVDVSVLDAVRREFDREFPNIVLAAFKRIARREGLFPDRFQVVLADEHPGLFSLKDSRTGRTVRLFARFGAADILDLVTTLLAAHKELFDHSLPDPEGPAAVPPGEDWRPVEVDV